MKILTVIGTRPEAIKMAPLIQLLHQNPAIDHRLCSSGQHKEMLDHVLSFFEIQPDFDLEIMREAQDLTDITVNILLGMRQVFLNFRPDWVLVHGDTSTSFAATLSAFYAGIKVAHIESGLRTWNLKSPFPEEANRVLTDKLATLYFAPTRKNFENLVAENIPTSNIHITGNTVIDALLWAQNKVEKFSDQVPLTIQQAYTTHRKILLVTGHRRENFGDGFDQICNALTAIALKYPEIGIVYPVHLNPNVRYVVFNRLSDIHNIYLADPLDYADFVYAMKNSWVILTDSGGVQEEAPSLGKPVLVMRDTTERPEAVEAGAVRLVGADCEKICEAVDVLWENPQEYKRMSKASNPYGDGTASEKIVEILLRQ